jgi:hypothetical protein
MRILLIASLLLLCGCISFSGARTSAPKARIMVKREFAPDGSLQHEEEHRELTGRATSGIDEFDGGGLELSDATLTVGGIAYRVKLPFKADRGLLWAGVGLIVAGAILFGWICKQWGLAALCGLLGVSIIGLAYHPWIAGLAAGLCLLAMLGYAVYALRRGYFDGKTKEMLARAIRESPDEMTEHVTERAKSKALRMRLEREIERLERI